jgi:thiol-disulfide isomerase/thioredoxin
VRAVLAVVVSLLIAACGSSARPAPVPGFTLGAPEAPSAAASREPPRVRVLMINGGGNPSINYRSHLMHLEQLHDLLTRAGVSPGRISVLASDGGDPGADLATREVQPEGDFWRLSGTRVERWLRTPVTVVDSRLPNVAIEPATKANVTRWFEAISRELGADDVLLLYVTDHGTRHGPDPLDNRITLWGNQEWITVRELGELIALLDPGVRVVSLMSQCFSGAFAELGAVRSREDGPTPNVCGYFASTADRRAYGCFPENRGVENVGYAFEFMRALERTGRFSDAHDAVLVDDDTPDVPIRTSDVYLESLIREDAQSRGVTLEAGADDLIREALKGPAAWERETRLLDRIAQATGSFSPRSLAELDELGRRLPEIDQQLTLVTRAWGDALGDANASNLEGFLLANPDWASRLAEPALARLDPPAVRSLTSSLLSDLTGFSARDASLERRVNALNTRGEGAKAASYRMQVRLAVVLRMRTLLLSIAGRQLLKGRGAAAQKSTFDGLTICEDLTFPGLGAAEGAAGERDSPPASASYPPFEEDVRLTREALPGWMGIRFKDPDEGVRRRQSLPPGASMVAVVFPDSPAQAAGLEPGDIVLGAPGEPFRSKNQVRAWTMLSEIGKPGELEILHEGRKKRVALVPAPFPVKWPALPGPVQIGAAAPDVPLESYRGSVATHLRKNSKRLLYFWATWCKPCKAALPELLAFEKEQKVPVVAVTDEGRDVLDAFVKAATAVLPKAVAMDPLRRAFVAYGVSGTPSFVLIDEHGKVAWSQVGYVPGRGLSIPGWSWSGRGATSP